MIYKYIKRLLLGGMPCIKEITRYIMLFCLGPTSEGGYSRFQKIKRLAKNICTLR